MIELFSRRIDGITLPPDAILTPMPIDDGISSLSAILLDNDYYDFLRNGVTTSDGIPVLSAAHLIPFKVKAWLDLTKRKAQGEQIHGKNIRKHKNDVIKLSGLLPAEYKMVLPNTIYNDMKKFFAEVDEPERYVRTAAAYNMSNMIPK